MSKPLSTRRDSAFLVVGVIRNGERTVGPDMRRLRTAIGEVKALHWFLVESDSADRTVGALETLKNSVENFDFVALGDLRGTYPRRTDRLAFCRNVYLERIREDERFGAVDYVIVSDLDGINAEIGPAAIESCWDRSVDWDMCAANQAGPYHDIWALRHKDWSPNDCWAQYRFLNRFDGNRERNIRSAVYAKMITIPAEHDWIEVDSAFGGLAIYRKDLFEDVAYEGTADNGEEICEHVSLHRSMRSKGARLYINPRLINSTYNEHSSVLLPGARAIRAVRDYLKSFLGLFVDIGRLKDARHPPRRSS